MNNITDPEKNTVAEEKKHHEFSPSSLECFALCPASWKMTKDLPRETNTYAEEGIMLHERCADNFNTKDLTTDQAVCVEKCERLIEVFQFAGAYKKIFIEQHLNIVDDNFQLLTEGTADVVIIHSNGKKAIIVDWKFGRSRVTVSQDNWQLATYALGVAQKYGVSEVEAFIFQPKVYPDSASYTFKDFDLIQSKIEKIIKDCKSESFIFNAGEKQCQYCRFKIQCNAYNAKYNAIALKANDLPALADEDLTGLYQKFIMAKSLLEQKFINVKAELESRILTKGSCNGYELKAGSKTATINDTDKVYEQLEELMLPSEFARCCKVQKTALETIYINRLSTQAKAEGVKVLKKDLKMDFKTLIEPFTTYKQNKPSIHLV